MADILRKIIVFLWLADYLLTKLLSALLTRHSADG